MKGRILNIEDLKMETKPIIIWGTKTAAKICYRLLKKINVNVVAAGDNNIQTVGKKLYEVPVLNLQEILSLYPNALIIIGSFFNNVSEEIILQLKTTNKQFSFCRFEQIEYLYELECLDRKIRDRDKLFRIINNVSYESDKYWKRNINKGVLTEYRYVIHDNRAEDLKRHLSNIYGVKNLVVIAGNNYINELESLIDELDGSDNIGHIIIVLDCKDPIDKKVLVRLSAKIFYVICDETASEKCLDDLEKVGLSIMTKDIPDEMFCHGADRIKTAVTEKVIVESVISYAGCEKNSAIHLAHLKPGPVHIVQLFNGLANQALMYLFGRFIEEESNRTVIFDDTILSLDITDKEENVRRIHRWTKASTLEETWAGVSETRKRNSFYKFKRAEIAEVFDIPIRLLSDYFDEITWNSYLEKIKREHSHKYAQSFPLCHVLLENNINMEIVRDSFLPKEYLPVNNCYCIDAYIWGKPYKKHNVTDFLLHCDENIYFMGGWADGRIEDWFLHNRQWVRNKLVFRLKMNEKNKMYAEIIKNSDSVMVHIRRGDFAYYKKSVSADFFNKAIQSIEKMTGYDNKKYFIFSDDLEWCRDHKQELGIDIISNNVTFVSGNEGADSYMDMYLISLGKIMIPTPGSSFSYVSMLLSDTIESCIDSQKYFYDLQHGLSDNIEIRKV